MGLRFLSASFWIFICCFINVFVELQGAKELSDEDIFLRSKYKEMDATLKKYTAQIYKWFLPLLYKASETVNISGSCLDNTLKIGMGARKLQLWAMQFVDATGKVNDGYLSGNIQMLGNYDQCLTAVARKRNGDTDFQGRYCLLSYKPLLPDLQNVSYPHIPVPRTIANTRNLSEILQYAIVKADQSKMLSFFGLCIPSGCGDSDVENIIQYVRDRTYMNITVENCQVQSETSYLNTRKIVIICVFACFGLLGIIGSAMEYYSKSKDVEFKGVTTEVLRCFSITTNFPSAISTKGEREMLSCLNGIRVLSAFYIIYVHKMVLLNTIQMKSNLLQYVQGYTSTFFYQIVTNGFLIIDIFFFMSGFLNMYVRMKRAAKESTINWWSAFSHSVIHRLWRLYPSFIVTILLLYLFTARGPFGAYYNQHFIEDCSGHLWKNILFLNNFYEGSNCLLHTWYISCDMQLFLLSLITMPLLVKKPKLGLILNASVIVFSLVTTCLWIYLKKIGPTYLANIEIFGGKLEAELPYMAPTSHAPSYFLGVLMGYFLSTKKNIKIPMVYQIIGWICASLAYTSMLFMTYRWNSGVPFTHVESAFYFAFSKPLYAAGVGWMIWCCLTGHGGIINYILSLKIWIPLSSMSFTIYLVSQLIQGFYLANIKTPVDTYQMVWIWEYFGDLCVSCLLALAITVLVEKPILRLEKLVFRRDNKKVENKKIENVVVKKSTFKEYNNGGFVGDFKETTLAEDNYNAQTEPSGEMLNDSVQKSNLKTDAWTNA